MAMVATRLSQRKRAGGVGRSARGAGPETPIAGDTRNAYDTKQQDGEQADGTEAGEEALGIEEPEVVVREVGQPEAGVAEDEDGAEVVQGGHDPGSEDGEQADDGPQERRPKAHGSQEHGPEECSASEHDGSEGVIAQHEPIDDVERHVSEPGDERPKGVDRQAAAVGSSREVDAELQLFQVEHEAPGGVNRG